MPVFGVILVRIQSKCGKMRTRITPNTDTCHAVSCNIGPIIAKIVVLIPLIQRKRPKEESFLKERELKSQTPENESFTKKVWV